MSVLSDELKRTSAYKNTMKKEHFIISGLLIIIGGLLIFQQCKPSPEIVYIKPKIDTKPIWKIINSKVAEIVALKEIGKTQDSIRTVYRDRWDIVKRDTLILTKTQIVNSCDSVLAANDSLVSKQKLIIAHQDTLVNKLWQLRAADSTNYALEIDSLKSENKGLKKDLRKQKWKTRGIIAAWILREGAGALNR